MFLNIIHLPHRTDRLALLHNELKEQEIKNFMLWECITDMEGNTTRAISKAHKQIVQHAKENNFLEILIAEDDIHFTAPGAFNYFLENKPLDFHLYLASVYSGEIKNDSTVCDFSGLTLYIVHQSFYEVFLSASENEDIDRSFRNKGKFIVCKPFTAIQHPGYSDHLKSNCDNSDYLKSSTLFYK